TAGPALVFTANLLRNSARAWRRHPHRELIGLRALMWPSDHCDAATLMAHYLRRSRLAVRSSVLPPISGRPPTDKGHAARTTDMADRRRGLPWLPTSLISTGKPRRPSWRAGCHRAAMQPGFGGETSCSPLP